MSHIQKSIEKIKTHPKDFTWEELVKVMNHYGYTEFKKGKTGGSRRKFVNDQKDIINLHKPHPQNIVKHYVLDIVIKKLGI